LLVKNFDMALDNLPMEPNPLSILTFIAAPAILTNSSSGMALGMSNRFARAIDRARALTAQVRGKESDPDPEMRLRVRQLRAVERRVLLLARAIIGYYLAVGSFAAASLISLLGAAFFLVHQDLLRHVTMGCALFAGLVGVSGLVTGSALLVWESRIALGILQDEIEFMTHSAPTSDIPV